MSLLPSGRRTSGSFSYLVISANDASFENFISENAESMYLFFVLGTKSDSFSPTLTRISETLNLHDTFPSCHKVITSNVAMVTDCRGHHWALLTAWETNLCSHQCWSWHELPDPPGAEPRPWWYFSSSEHNVLSHWDKLHRSNTMMPQIWQKKEKWSVAVV